MVRVKKYNAASDGIRRNRLLLRIISFVLLFSFVSCAGPAAGEEPSGLPAVQEQAVLSTLAGAAAASGWQQFEQPAGADRYSSYMFYWVYTPADMEPGLPLVVYLHSSEGVKHGPLKDIMPALMDDGTISDPHAVILVPQLPRSLSLPWAKVVGSLESIVETVINDYEVDTSRISLCGVSLGGIGVWELASRSPGKYARIMCVVGKVEAGIEADSFKGSEIRVYSATGDKVGNPKSSEDFVSALNQIGVDATYELLSMKHLEAPMAVFSDAEVQEWLWLNPRKSADPQNVEPTEVPKATVAPPVTPTPVPTVTPEVSDEP